VDVNARHVQSIFGDNSAESAFDHAGEKPPLD